MAHPRVVEALWTHLQGRARGEGYREDIYVDNVGLPTVGTGMMLRQSDQVRRLSWVQASTRAPVSAAAAIAAWRPFQPGGDRTPSAAGREARARRGSGATVIPQYRATRGSIFAYYKYLVGICEARAKEAMSSITWNASPADAQFSILLHLWRAPNELRNGWPLFRAALQRRDWFAAAEQCTWPGMRQCRRIDLQAGFTNAAFVEQAHLDSGVGKTTLHFPSSFVIVSRDRWRGVTTGAP